MSGADLLQRWRSFRTEQAKRPLAEKGLTVLPLALALLGMLLILFSSFRPQISSDASAQPNESEELRRAAQYEQTLETRLEALLTALDGAGRVKVMLTLAGGQETIYAVDTQAADAQLRQTHVLLQNGTVPLTETVCFPQIRGVAVVCEGGGDPVTAAHITALLASLLDLGYSDICVRQGSP